MTEPIADPTLKPKPLEKPQDDAKLPEYKKRFEDAVTDAQHLLMYASTTCPKDINRETLDKLIAARRRLEKNEPLTPKEEVEFWLAYQDIWKLVQPVTAESIKANLQNENSFTSKLLDLFPGLSRWFGKGRSSTAEKSVNRYVVFTVFVLVFLLIMQIYWVIGNRLTTQLSGLLQREEEVNLEINKNQQAYIGIEILYKQNEINSENFKSSGTYTFYSTPEWERDILETVSTRDRLEAELALVRSQLERNSSILLIWSGPWDGLIKNEEMDAAGVLIPVTGGDSYLSDSDKYALQIESINAQIAAIDQQLTFEDADGTNAAELLNSTITPRLQGIDDQLAVLYADNNDLYVLEAETQKQIEDIKIQLESVNSSDTTVESLSTTLNDQLANLKQQRETIENQIAGIKSQPTTDPATGESLESALAAQLTGLEAEKQLVESQIVAFENQLSVISGNKTALDDLETSLIEVGARKDFNTAQIQGLEAEKQGLIAQLVPAGEIVNQWREDKQRLTDEMNTLLRQQQADARRESSRQAQLAGEFVLVILQSYLLPLLYGILGASTSVLRTLSKQVENVLYSEGAKIQHLLRIALGALSGIMVGWFSFLLPSESTNFLGSVSPLALAFLVGYNIELFFSLMDVALNKVNEARERNAPITDQPQPVIATPPPAEPSLPEEPVAEDHPAPVGPVG